MFNHISKETLTWEDRPKTTIKNMIKAIKYKTFLESELMEIVKNLSLKGENELSEVDRKLLELLSDNEAI